MGLMHLPTTQGASGSAVSGVRQQPSVLRPICDEIFIFAFLFIGFPVARFARDRLRMMAVSVRMNRRVSGRDAMMLLPRTACAISIRF
jgi:hypothetical protein